MKRELRSCLAAKYYDDVDMDNAHFRLLLDDCENRCIRCDKIRQWVNDRETILLNIMGAHKVAFNVANQNIDRDTAKEAFIKICSPDESDPYKSFPAKFNLNYDEQSCRVINDLFEEAKVIRKKILEEEAANNRHWQNRQAVKHIGGWFALYMQTKCSESPHFVFWVLKSRDLKYIP